jgi:hypothetical protein
LAYLTKTLPEAKLEGKKNTKQKDRKKVKQPGKNTSGSKGERNQGQGEQNGKSFRIWAGVLAPVFAAVITIIFTTKCPARFVLETTIVKINEPIIIKAANRAAKKEKPLNVEFDKHMFYNAGIPLKKEGDKTQRWRFKIMDYDHTHEMLKLGPHTVRVAFSGDDLSREQAISFKKDIPPSPDKSWIIIIAVLIALGIIAAIIFKSRGEQRR